MPFYSISAQIRVVICHSMLMARGKLTFRIRPVCESCAASKKYNNQLRMPSNGRRKDLTIKY